MPAEHMRDSSRSVYRCLEEGGGQDGAPIASLLQPPLCALMLWPIVMAGWAIATGLDPVVGPAIHVFFTS